VGWVGAAVWVGGGHAWLYYMMDGKWLMGLRIRTGYVRVQEVVGWVGEGEDEKRLMGVRIRKD